MQFLQPTQSEAYAKNAVPTQALRFGTAQPFWTLTQRCGSNTNQSKTSWTKPRDCLRLLLCSFLGFEPTSTIQLDCNNCLNLQDPKIFLKKLSSTNQRQATSTLRSLMPPSDDRQPILSSHHDDGCSVCCHH